MTKPKDMSIATTPRGSVEGACPDEVADIVGVILDKGMIADAFVRVAPIGTEMLMVDSRMTSASIDTYLRFVEGVNRLDISDDDHAGGLPRLVSETPPKSKTTGAAEGLQDRLESHNGVGAKRRTRR